MERDNVDTTIVRYYQMRGRLPDLNNDVLLGESSNFASNHHHIDLRLNQGEYHIYLVGIDRAGNQSIPSRVKQVTMVDERNK